MSTDENENPKMKSCLDTVPDEKGPSKILEAGLDPALAASISASLAHLGGCSGPRVVSAKRNSRSRQTEFYNGMILAKPQNDAGLKPTCVFHNLSVAELYEKALATEPGTHIVSSGALATVSGAKGLSPMDNRIMRDPGTEHEVWWGPGSSNFEMDEKAFLINRARSVDYLNTLDRLYVFDGFVNWDPKYRFKVRVITARAYQALFMHNLLIVPTAEELAGFGEPDFVIYNAGAFPCNRYSEYMTSSTSVDLSLKHRELVILGTQYAGCMKKGIFTMMNYLLPKHGVLSLHSGCNVGPAGDVSLFFGMSGAGKTTLSADPQRRLIGDDEHGWSADGIFNIEGGCYAKVINLTPEAKPYIFEAIRFGTVLENVVFDAQTYDVDFTDGSLSDNARAAYPIRYMRNAEVPCVGTHPKNIIMLVCDGFGVLPPVSRLTTEQAMYHFVSGYSLKVGRSDSGEWEPQASFSACFGSGFLVWHPYKYAGMLAERMTAHGTVAWLVNTGWTGGPMGVGRRIGLELSQAIVDAVHSGELASAECETMGVFNLRVPVACSGVPPEMMLPERTWEDPQAFQQTLEHLGWLFHRNFRKFADGAGMVSPSLAASIAAAGPVVAHRLSAREAEALYRRGRGFTM